MLLHVAPNSGETVPDQLVRQLGDRIANGDLARGARLPAPRSLARLQRVPGSAVLRAYHELLASGLLTTSDNGAFEVARTHGTPPVPAHLPIETAHRGPTFADDLKGAIEVQRSMAPPATIELDGIAVAARWSAARGVAGDLYEIVRHTDGTVGVVLGDVAGSGLAAGLVGASVKAVLPFLVKDRQAHEALRTLNDRLCGRLAHRRFVALCVLRIDGESGGLTIANAGLPDPYLLRPGAGAEPLSVPGPRLPLGVRRGLAYQAAELTLAPGDRLALATDGIVEAPTPSGVPLGYRALECLLTELAGSAGPDTPPDSVLDRLWRSVRRAAGRPDDDATLVLVQRADVDEGGPPCC